jgi:TonB family protein
MASLVALSLVAHGLFIAAVARMPEPTRPPFQRPLEMDLLTVILEPEAAPLPPVPAPPPLTAPTRKNTGSTAKSDAVADAVTEPSSASAEVASSGISTIGDMPVAARPSLLPSEGLVLGLGPRAPEPVARGTTVRNGPGEAPDVQALHEYTGEKLTRMLNAQLQQEVGLAATAVGNVPTHFKRYEEAMRQALPKARIETTPLSGGAIAQDAVGTLFGSGPTAEAQRQVADSALGRSILQQNVMMPNIDDQRSREASLGMMAQGEALKERARRARLRTVLEVTTDASGALAEVSIVEKSGDSRFDESVMHFSRKVARGVPDADDKMLGASMWRTRWQFTWEPPDVRVRLLNAWRVPNNP